MTKLDDDLAALTVAVAANTAAANAIEAVVAALIAAGQGATPAQLAEIEGLTTTLTSTNSALTAAMPAPVVQPGTTP